MIGLSIYPERSTFEQDKAYLDLAHKYGYKRIFTSLLQIEGDKDEVMKGFKKVIDYANSLSMEVMIDIAPHLFKQLDISYDELKFFHDLGAYGIRLDVGFTGSEEARMTRNPYGLKIEINMSAGTKYVDQIMAYSPNKDNLIGSHNFYPMEYSGLDYDFFVSCSEQFRGYNIRTAAFVNAPSATFGPWPTADGLCTLEIHRELPIATQVKHLLLTGLIDDILIGNAYASEEDLKAMAEAYNAPHPKVKVVLNDNVTDVERKVLFGHVHSYRGDRSSYMLRSTMTRIYYAKEDFPPHDTNDITRGDVIIPNKEFGHYNGEMQIALREMKNKGRINIVGRVSDDELFLLDFLRPWSTFELEEVK